MVGRIIVSFHLIPPSMRAVPGPCFIICGSGEFRFQWSLGVRHLTSPPGGHVGLPGWAQSHHTHPFLWEGWEAEVMVILCEKDLTTVAGFDDGERGMSHTECGRPLGAGKGKTRSSPLELPEGAQPCPHSGF